VGSQLARRNPGKGENKAACQKQSLPEVEGEVGGERIYREGGTSSAPSLSVHAMRQRQVSRGLHSAREKIEKNGRGGKNGKNAAPRVQRMKQRASSNHGRGCLTEKRFWASKLNQRGVVPPSLVKTPANFGEGVPGVRKRTSLNKTIRRRKEKEKEGSEKAQGATKTNIRKQGKGQGVFKVKRKVLLRCGGKHLKGNGGMPGLFVFVRIPLNVLGAKKFCLTKSFLGRLDSITNSTKRRPEQQGKIRGGGKAWGK